MEDSTSMKYGFMGMLFSKMFAKTIYEYTQKAVPQIDIRAFKKKHIWKSTQTSISSRIARS